MYNKKIRKMIILGVTVISLAASSAGVSAASMPSNNMQSQMNQAPNGNRNQAPDGNQMTPPEAPKDENGNPMAPPEAPLRIVHAHRKEFL